MSALYDTPEKLALALSLATHKGGASVSLTQRAAACIASLVGQMRAAGVEPRMIAERAPISVDSQQSRA